MLAAIWFVGCGSETPSRPAETPVETTEGSAPAETQVETPGASAPAGVGELYRCDVIPFDPALLLRPGTAETDADAAAEALRVFLASPIHGGFMPSIGWRRLGSNASTAEFANGAPDGPGYVSVRFERQGGSWTPASWGGCLPRRVVGPARLGLVWWLANGAPDPANRTLDVETVVDDCKIGPPVDAILEPDVVLTDTAVIVALTAVQTGPLACLDTSVFAQGRPTSTRIELPAEVGDRVVSDASEFPPRDAKAPPDWYFGTGG